MSYATKAYMITRYDEQALIQLTDRAEVPTGEIDDDVLDAALAEADSVVDSYLAPRYKVPLLSVPPIIPSKAAAIAYFILHRGRHSDETRQAYDDAIAFLKDVGKGVAQLDAEGLEPSSAIADARVIASERTFSRDSLKGF